MKARIATALGPYWGGIAHATEVLAGISALGAVGSVPALLNALTGYTRVAARRLRRQKPCN
jgi:hypothetical protein